ncbi:MAG: AAA family ATPase [Planctomycetota bacterium]
MTAERPDPDPPPLLELLAHWLRAPNSPRAHGALLAALPGAPVAELRETLDLTLRDAVRVRRGAELLKRSHAQLEQQLAQLSQPPHCLARLLDFDAATRRAVVGTGPAARFQVPVHDDVDPSQLRQGTDVLLNGDRSCVLRALPAGTAPATARVVAFRRFVDANSGDTARAGLRPALCGDGGGEVLVWVPPALAERLQQGLDAGRSALRVGVDEYGLAVALCGGDEEDPAAAAARFAFPLAPLAAAGIVGLAAQRAAVADAVARSREHGAFVLAQGTTGCGKTHLARHALHLLLAHGDAAVLSLRSTRDHRFHGQEESDVEDLFACARALAAAGRPVLLFADELDRHFFRSRYGESVHVNAARATWLAQIGDALPGVLLYGTTNKSGNLPDELHNRVTHPLSFGRIERAQMLALLDLYLPADATPPVARHALLDAVTAALHDGVEGSAVATVHLRDQSRVPLFARDLRQLSARFLKELALRLGASARDGGLTPGRARALALARVAEVTESLALSVHNVADRTFVEFAPRNPPERLVPAAPAARAADALFRYQPLEVADVAHVRDL